MGLGQATLDGEVVGKGRNIKDGHRVVLAEILRATLEYLETRLLCISLCDL